MSNNKMVSIAHLRREHLAKILGLSTEEAAKFSYNDLVYRYAQAEKRNEVDPESFANTLIGGLSAEELGSLQAVLNDYQAAVAEVGKVGAALGPMIDARTRTGTRPVGQDELVINAADYGVLANGQDASAALTSLAAQLPSRGGMILLPSGNLVLSNPVPFKSYTRFVGAGGRGTNIILTVDAPAFIRNGAGVRTDQFALREMRIQRTAGTSTNPIIDLTNVSHSALADLELQDISSGAAGASVTLDGNCHYNRIEGVQVHNARTAFLLRNQANRNLISGGLAINCHDGYVLDNVNSNRLIAVAGEHMGNDGVRVQNYARANLILGASVEDVGGACFRVRNETDSGLYSLWNHFAFCYASPWSGVDYDLRFTNFRVDHTTLRALSMLPHDLRTYVRAFRTGTTQSTIPANTWTRVAFNATQIDHLAEMPGETFTASTAGIYQVSASALFPTSTSGVGLDLAVYVNGSAQDRIASLRTPGSNPAQVTGSSTVKLAAGDTVEIFARSTLGVAISADPTTTYVKITRHA